MQLKDKVIILTGAARIGWWPVDCLIVIPDLPARQSLGVGGIRNPQIKPYDWILNQVQDDALYKKFIA